MMAHNKQTAATTAGKAEDEERISENTMHGNGKKTEEKQQSTCRARNNLSRRRRKVGDYETLLLEIFVVSAYFSIHLFQE